MTESSYTRKQYMRCSSVVRITSNHRTVAHLKTIKTIC